MLYGSATALGGLGVQRRELVSLRELLGRILDELETGTVSEARNDLMLISAFLADIAAD